MIRRRWLAMGLFNVAFGLLTIAVASPLAGLIAFTGGALMIFTARGEERA